MGRSPSIVPGNDPEDVYLVLDDFGGRLGWAWRETNVDETDLETVVRDLLEGQYCNPIRIVGFNTAQGWSRDVSDYIAHELTRRCVDQKRQIPAFLQEFVDRHKDRGVQFPFLLALLKVALRG